MLKFLIEKEFKQIRRNAFMPKLIVALPTIMMFVLPWAANQEVRDVSLAVVDNDHSTFSRRHADAHKSRRGNSGHCWNQPRRGRHDPDI